MGKPEDIGQEAWDAAKALVPDHVRVSIVEGIARAILAAEKRGEEREREAAIATCKTEAEICKKNGLPHEALGSLWCASAIGLQAAIRKRGA